MKRTNPPPPPRAFPLDERTKAPTRPGEGSDAATARDYLPTQLDDEFLVELGRVTETFSALEHSLKLLAGAMVSEDDELGRIITAQLPFRALLDLVGSLALYRFEHNPLEVEGTPLLEHIVRVLRDAEAVEQRRNDIIHSAWMLGMFTDTAIRVKHTARKKKGLAMAHEHMAPRDMRVIAADASACGADVIKAWARLAHDPSLEWKCRLGPPKERREKAGG